MTKRLRTFVLIAALALVGAACAQDETPDQVGGDGDEITLEITLDADELEGNVLSLPISVQGIEIKPADGDDSGETGHFHVFIDSDPVDVGETMPVERDIVHSAENPVTIWGLEPGEHEFTVVVGNGVHQRIGDVSDSVTVDVKGPSVRGTAPATIEEGDDLEVELASEGVEIKGADGDTSGDSGHYHVLVDPDQAPKAGEVLPDPKEGEVYHSAEDTVTIEGLSKGPHTLYVVLGDGVHEAFEPSVMDKLTVTVE